MYIKVSMYAYLSLSAFIYFLLAYNPEIGTEPSVLRVRLAFDRFFRVLYLKMIKQDTYYFLIRLSEYLSQHHRVDVSI